MSGMYTVTKVEARVGYKKTDGEGNVKTVEFAVEASVLPQADWGEVRAALYETLVQQLRAVFAPPAVHSEPPPERRPDTPEQARGLGASDRQTNGPPPQAPETPAASGDLEPYCLEHGVKTKQRSRTGPHGEYTYYSHKTGRGDQDWCNISNKEQIDGGIEWR